MLGSVIHFAILSRTSVYAQEMMLEPGGGSEQKELETDRDAFTPAVTTVGRGALVFESAYTFIDNRDSADTHSFPEMLTRYGVSDWIELRLGWNYEIGGGNPVTGTNSAGAESEAGSHIFYGAKFQLTEQEKWLPTSFFMAQGFTPTSGEETSTQFAGTYGLGWELTKGIRWDSAIRYSTAGESDDRFNEWAPSTVLRVPLSEGWHAHIEYFSLHTEGRSDELNQAFVSPGIHYLVTPNLELGTRVGWGITRDASNFFVNTGVGIRY
jgi:hypothetical protein